MLLGKSKYFRRAFTGSELSLPSRREGVLVAAEDGVSSHTVQRERGISVREGEWDMSVQDFFQEVDKAKLREALSSDDPNELRAVAEDAGFELTDEQLDFIAGGVGLDEDETTSSDS